MPDSPYPAILTRCPDEVGAWAADGAEAAAGVEAVDGATGIIQWAFPASHPLMESPRITGPPQVSMICRRSKPRRSIFKARSMRSGNGLRSSKGPRKKRVDHAER